MLRKRRGPVEFIVKIRMNTFTSENILEDTAMKIQSAQNYLKRP
jgi:hypothetical protein